MPPPIPPTIGLQPGDFVLDYRVVRKIGEGGMGMVYECVRDRINQRAALKTLHVNLNGMRGLSERFFNEARAANRIPHPGVVHVFDCGQLADDTLYLLMEYVEGETLSYRLHTAKKVPPHALVLDALPILHQLAGILKVAHKNGVTHRDLKPSNIMLVADPAVRGGDRVRLLDFGIAKLHDVASESNLTATAGQLTRTGMILGTPDYMAPEQATSPGRVTDRADVYSLGVIAYELIVGRLPVTGDNPLAVLANKIAFVPPAMRQLNAELPADLDALVSSMLVIEPGERPPMADIEREFAAMQGMSVPRRSRLSAQVPAVPSPPSPLTMPTMDAVPVPLDEPKSPSGDAARKRNERAEAPSPELPISPVVRAASATPDAHVAPVPPGVVVAHATAPTIHGQRTRWVVLIVALAVSAAATMTILLKPPPSRIIRPDMMSDHLAETLARPADAAAASSAPVSFDLGPAVAPHLVAARAPEVPSKPKPTASRCQLPRSSWISGVGVTDAVREQVAEAFANAPMRMCPGEKIVISLRPKDPNLIDVPSRLTSDELRTLRTALRGWLLDSPLKTSIVIKCPR